MPYHRRPDTTAHTRRFVWKTFLSPKSLARQVKISSLANRRYHYSSPSLPFFPSFFGVVGVSGLVAGEIVLRRLL
jgi:hypothetical protein